eukprot:9770697-Lingulodinium_polyedra.AAC.1
MAASVSELIGIVKDLRDTQMKQQDAIAKQSRDIEKTIHRGKRSRSDSRSPRGHARADHAGPRTRSKSTLRRRK